MVCQAGPCFCFHGLCLFRRWGCRSASGRLAAAPRKRPEAVSGGRTLCAPTHLCLCGDVPCIPRAAPRPPFIRAPSVWCPFFRRGAQCAPAYLCLYGDVPPGGRTPPPFCTAPSVWCPFFRRGAQRAPAYLCLRGDVPYYPRGRTPSPFYTGPAGLISLFP